MQEPGVSPPSMRQNLASRGLVLVVGEALVDVVVDAAGRVDERVGGSPANVAVALARAGHRVVLATQLGNDARGARVRAHLAESHVEVLAAEALRTSTAVARLQPDGSAAYDFDVIWDPAFPSLPQATDVVHVGSFSAVNPPGCSAVTGLLDAFGSKGGPIVSYDINVRPALFGEPYDARPRVEALVRRAHVVKASDEDLAWLYPTLSWEQAATALHEQGPHAVFVTRGAAGSTVLALGKRADIPAEPVEVVDTIGAGDTFSAGVLHGLWELGLRDPGGLAAADIGRWRAAGERATAMAAATAARKGADPPWLS